MACRSCPTLRVGGQVDGLGDLGGLGDGLVAGYLVLDERIELGWRQRVHDFAADLGHHLRANRAAVGFGAGEFYPQPVVVELLVVAQEQRRAARLGDEHVQVAIAVDVALSQRVIDQPVIINVLFRGAVVVQTVADILASQREAALALMADLAGGMDGSVSTVEQRFDAARAALAKAS